MKKVSSQFTELCDEIKTNYFNNTPSFVVVPAPTNNSEEKCAFFECDNRYLISDICFDYLSQIEATSDEKDEFIQLYQSIFAGDAERTTNAQIFQESYLPDRALSWFRKDNFFQQILEGIFQTVDTKSMYLCRFLIRDIRNQFETNNWISTITVYRGQLMSDEHVRQLMNSQGKIIVMSKFLSTTINREVAMMFISEACERKRVLFEIEANPEIPGAKPFIKIGRLFDFEEDEEVVFMLGPLFKVNEVRDDENGITIVKMSLCANEQKNEILSQLSNVHEKKDLIGFAHLQFALGRILNYPELLTNIDAMIQKGLAELSEDHPDQIRCYDLLGLVTLAANDLDSCIQWCQKSLDMKKKILPTNDLKLVLSYDLIAYAFSRKNGNAQAIDALKQILKIYQQDLGDQHSNLIPYYVRMIDIHQSEAQFTEVLLCYNQVYNIMLRNYSIDDENFASIYHNIGNTFVDLSQYPLALGYYQTSLNIKLKHFPPESESIALSYKNIGLTYKYMNNIDEARTHFQKAIEIYRQVPSSTEQVVLEIEQLIETLSATPS